MSESRWIPRTSEARVAAQVSLGAQLDGGLLFILENLHKRSDDTCDATGQGHILRCRGSSFWQVLKVVTTDRNKIKSQGATKKIRLAQKATAIGNRPPSHQGQRRQWVSIAKKSGVAHGKRAPRSGPLALFLPFLDRRFSFHRFYLFGRRLSSIHCICPTPISILTLRHADSSTTKHTVIQQHGAHHDSITREQPHGPPRQARHAQDP